MRKFPKTFLSLVLSGAILATGGIVLANGSSLSASAEEGISPAYTVVVATPKISYATYNTMVEFTWTGDSGGYMYVGDNINPNYGHIVVENSGTSCIYREFRVPAIDMRYSSMKYFWAQSFAVDADGDIWESERTMFTGSYYAGNTVTDRIVSGSLMNSYKTLSAGYEEGDKLYFSFAYGGECANGNIDMSVGAVSGIKTIMASGVTCTVYAVNGVIQVKTSKSVTCSDTSSKQNGYAAFAIYVS